jgi:exopolyphosphatase/guanosine-5'-triphosphate,3'-diphosphate pyrophosphatase
MAHTRRAVIDVGTNSVKLLVADVAGRDVRPVHEAGNQTRLGAGLYITQRLQPAAVTRTATAVRDYAVVARELGAASVRVFATSAAREATNPQDLIAAIQKACGLKLDVVTGEQEAEWAFRGATTNPGLASEPLLLLEVGGGSTQFILGQGDQIHFRESYPLGAVRLLERFPHSDPPKAAELAGCRAWVSALLDEQVVPELGPALGRERELHAKHHAALLVGTGGTATVLVRMERGMTDYDRAKIESVRLDCERFSEWLGRLWSVRLAERKQIVGLPPERADVILTGALIYQAALEKLGFAELRVSTRGLRFAAVMEPGV